MAGFDGYGEGKISCAIRGLNRRSLARSLRSPGTQCAVNRLKNCFLSRWMWPDLFSFEYSNEFFEFISVLMLGYQNWKACLTDMQ